MFNGKEKKKEKQEAKKLEMIQTLWDDKLTWTYREIIDGQQRLRAITEYIQNRFPISKTHNELYGGMRYEDLDEETQEQILDYDIL